MDVALVTGASSALGLAISRRLLDLGFRVYGLGGRFDNLPFQNVDFRPVSVDLGDPQAVDAKVAQILEEEGAICAVINNAKLVMSEDLEGAELALLDRCLKVNLLCPMVLVRRALPGLRRLQGHIINVVSAWPETSRSGVVGAAAAGGLRWMSERLFLEAREQGVRVTQLAPESNRWRPVDAPPPAAEHPQSVIDPATVAEAVADVLSLKGGSLVTEIVLRPSRLVEPDLEPVRNLPYPEPQPIPYTVPREVIEAEEQLETEARKKAHKERQEKRRAARRERAEAERGTAETDTDVPVEEVSDATPEAGSKEQAEEPRPKEGRRRRNRRNRGRPRRPGEPAESTPERARRDESRATHRAQAGRPEGGAAESVEAKPAEAGTGPRDAGESPSEPPADVDQRQPVRAEDAGGQADAVEAETPSSASADAVPVKKAAAKKAASRTKKAARKTAAKKATAKKKTAKKAATKKPATKKTARKRTAKKVASTTEDTSAGPHDES